MINMNINKTLEKENRNNIFVLVVLIIFGITSRLLPHPANFTSIGAILLFGGFYFKKEWKIIAPLAIMFISDSFLGFYDLKLMAVVYFCFFLYFIFGHYIKSNKIFLGSFGFSLLGSTLFFIITNFAVWAFAGWYPHTSVGLLNCYFLALPFFFNTLAGDLFYTGAIFGIYKLAEDPKKILNYKRYLRHV